MNRYDVHSRFARAHLRTREERAVYFTLVAQLAHSWSADEIARLKGIDARTVQAVLDRYAEAGIVQPVYAPAGRRYRWRADMTYLFGSGSRATKLIDPVCGMTVDERTPYRFEDANHRLWVFCSAICMSTFEAVRAG